MGVMNLGQYVLGKKIGSGNYSIVRQGTDAQGRKWAVKIIKKARLRQDNMEDQMFREVAVMRSLRHENIIALRDVLESNNHYYLVLEFVSGGELFDKIVGARRFDEPTARNYFHQLIAGIRYCHSKGFAHRDLKPENLLLDANGTLKITDFGLSNRQQDTLLQTVCGTPNYAAPEVLMERGYNGLSADVWSCGVVLYVMLAGRLPFDDPNMSALLAKIERGEYQMVRDVSDAVKDLIARMLIVDPNKRITLEDIIAHPWFQVDWVDIGLSLDGGSTTTCSEASSNFNGGSMCLPESLGAFELCCDAVESCECSVSGRDVRDDNNVALACVLGSRDDVNDASESVFLKTSMGSTETLFHLEGTVADVECALESVGGNPREKRPMELKGYIDAENGLLTYTAVITETDIPNVISVAIQRGRGDVSDFQYFYGQLLALVNSKLRSVTACVTNSTKYEVD